jgi:uncharacterized protein YggE
VAGGAGALGLLVLGALAARLTSAPAVASMTPIPGITPTSSGAIVASGSATVDVIPDLARLVLSVQTTAATAGRAESENAAAAESVLSRIQASGIPGSDIKTLGIQVWPQYDYRSAPPLLNGFVATQTLQVTIRDLRRIGALIDAAVAGGATSVQGITYDLQDHTAASGQALAKAVADARGKAQAMADAAGVRLGSVVSMTDIESAPLPFPMIRAAAPSATGSATQVSPPDIQLTMSVTVSWTLG